MTSFIAAVGSGRSASVIPAVPAAWSVTTIAFILDTSVYQSSPLPIELGFGSGQTCHRRLCEWTEAAVWPALHAELLKRLRQADQLDWDRVCIDASHVQAKKAAPRRARARSTAASR